LGVMVKVVVRSSENGPNKIWVDDVKITALCRCGQSKKMPYCDGTHRECGFTAEPAEVKIVD
jgi:CDGSH-type Zn-finger protein